MFVPLQPDNTHIVAGMSNGFLSVKYRLNQDVKGQVTTNRKLTAGTYPFFLHGKSSRSQEVCVPHCHVLCSLL